MEYFLNQEPINTDYAWAAGFIDGEGSFSLRVYHRKFTKNKYTKKEKVYFRESIQPIVQISQMDKEPLKRIQWLANSPRDPYAEYREDRSYPYWHLYIIGKERLLKFLKKIQPYLLVKKEQCDLLIEALNRQGNRGCNRYTDGEWDWFHNMKLKIEQINRGYKNG